jgi:hypothetical protein
MAFTPYGAVQQTLSGPLPSAALYDTGSWLDTGGIPKDIAFGWVASTGSAEDDHAISNVEVQTLLPMPILDTASTEYGTTVSNGSPVTYVDTPTIQPGSSTEAQAVTVADTLPANVTVTSGGGTGWSCSAPTGSVATGQTISCTTTGSGPWTTGTALPPVDINGVVAGSLTSQLYGTTSGNYVLMSSSDAEPGSTNTSTNQALPSAPTITSLSPASGTVNGGGSVTVTGTNLTAATQVEIGAAAQIAAGTGTLLALQQYRVVKSRSRPCPQSRLAPTRSP